MTARRQDRFATAIAAWLALANVGAAQDAVRFQARQPLARLEIRDLPALLASLPGTALGRLAAEPDVAAAFELGKQNFAALVARWTRIVDATVRLDPGRMEPE